MFDVYMISYRFAYVRLIGTWVAGLSKGLTLISHHDFIVCLGLLGVTSSLNPNGVGLESNPAFLMARPQCEKSAATPQDTKVTLAQDTGQCHITTIKAWII